MKIRRIDKKGLRLSGLMADDLRLLEQIPLHADPAGSPAAEERLFQDPVRQPNADVEERLADDWRECVLPELRTEFARQLDVVTADLQSVRTSSSRDGARYEFLIPFDHVESWYGALNQARLVMQERYRFPERETANSLVTLMQSPNFQPFLTSRFYIQLQSALIDLALDREVP